MINSLQSRILIYFFWLWYSTWEIWEHWYCMQKLCSRLLHATRRILFSLEGWYKLMVQWVRLVMVSCVTWIQFQQGVETKIFSALGHFENLHWVKPISAQTCVISYYYNILKWRSGFDRVLILNMNIWLSLNSIGSWAKCPDLATCAGLEHRHDYSYDIASEPKQQKGSATVLPWIDENTWNTIASTADNFSILAPKTAFYWPKQWSLHC